MASNLGKIYEKMLNIVVSQHMADNGLWYEDQYGFRPHHSTAHAITKFTAQVQSALAQRKYFAVVFLDCAKAFNCVPRSLLVEKLKWYGFDAQISETIDSYLATDDKLASAESYTLRKER